MDSRSHVQGGQGHAQVLGVQPLLALADDTKELAQERAEMGIINILVRKDGQERVEHVGHIVSGPMSTPLFSPALFLKRNCRATRRHLLAGR